MATDIRYNFRKIKETKKSVFPICCRCPTWAILKPSEPPEEIPARPSNISSARPSMVRWVACHTAPCVQCAVCSVQCTVCSGQCAVCSGQWPVCSVQCAASSVPCIMFSVQYATYLWLLFSPHPWCRTLYSNHTIWRSWLIGWNISRCNLILQDINWHVNCPC